ncbi:MAG: hypothetical protein HW380_3248 [Magnetococcales bacterium]|nr:hypothetical protein [Magnetococcales bacterium]HIJ84073.1 hypothetical protein [Magnetococcales bacterium]
MGRIFLLFFSLAIIIFSFHTPLEEAWKHGIGAWKLPFLADASGKEVEFKARLSHWLTDGRIGGTENAIQTLRSDIAGLRQQLDTLQQEAAQSAGKNAEQFKILQDHVDQIKIGLPELTTSIDRQRESLSQEMSALAKADWRIEQGNQLVEKQDQDWKLVDVFFKKRTLKKGITFQTPFSENPVVHLGITSLDFAIDEGGMQVYAEEIQPQGFTLVVESQSTDRIRTVGLLWTAFGHP